MQPQSPLQPRYRALARNPAIAVLLILLAQPALETGAQAAAGRTKTTTGGTRLSESDRIQLNSAAAACKQGDAAGFFSAFAGSAAVRRRYTAPTVRYSVTRTKPTYRVLEDRRMDESSYGGFPIRMGDYYYRSVKPLRPGDQHEYVMLDINQSQTNQISVEWTRVHFDGKSEGGDDLGNAYTLDGKPYSKEGSQTDGQLLFAPTANCWQLVADIRHQRGRN